MVSARSQAGLAAAAERILARFPEALIGECGLDGIKNPDDEPQNSIFYQHLFLAEELQRPLIIHAVKAQDWLENYWDMLPENVFFIPITANARC